MVHLAIDRAKITVLKSLRNDYSGGFFILMGKAERLSSGGLEILKEASTFWL